MTDKMRHVFIIGLGLIGGSIALAIRKNHKVTISGFDVNAIALDQAISLGIIDYRAETIEEGAKVADLIILAAPVERIQQIIGQLSKVDLKENVMITDVGSTKRQIVDTANQVLSDKATFIGGHPMAGSHKSGVFAAKAHLFENAFYFLTPGRHVEDDKVERLKEWLSGTKAAFIKINPGKHDEIVAVISHFPHIVASALVHQLAKFPDNGLNVSRLAAGGFRDITRIASADPTMWQEVCLNNRDILLELFDQWEIEMNRVKQLLLEENKEGVFSFFNEAKTYRDHIPSKEKGVIPSFYDLYVDVPDYPGIIAKVTEIIATAGISITNIRIIEFRENILGALRISFQSNQSREEAAELLETHNFKTYLDD